MSNPDIIIRSLKNGNVVYDTPNTMFIDDSIASVATEAISTVMNVNGEPMKIFLATDDVIEDNHLQQVSNPISFNKGNIPTPDGVFSEIIFGVTQTEKKLNHGYIDLKTKFFHPYVYEVLCELHQTITEVVTGEDAWTIVDGKYKKVTDESSKDYNPNNTGLSYVIKTFRKLSYEKNNSIGHNNNVDFITMLTDKEALISKYIIIPRFYRDYSANGRMLSVDSINNMYTRLISLCNSLDNDIIGYISHKTMMAIQNQLVTIRKHGQSLIQKKEGMIHRSVLGRNTSYAARGVISVPSLIGADYPEDCQVDMIHTGIPLRHCLTAGYPLILKWLMDWVAREASGGPMEIYLKNEDGKYAPSEVRIKDHTTIFNKAFIDKRILMYIHGFGGRWAPIKLQTEDNREVYLRFHGEILPGEKYNLAMSSISDRPLTWCDLMYMAAEDMLSDKHVYSTRYPAEDYFNIVASRICVLSTLKTMPLLVNGKVYKHYPIIDPFAKENVVARSFIDTICTSNLHLSGYRGDYDGDTVSLKFVFSQEANLEAEKHIHSITNFLTVNGNLIRTLGNESVLCLYNMTRRVD